MTNKVTTIITTDKAVANNETRLSICLRSNGFSFSVSTLDHVLLTFGEADFDFNLPFADLAKALKDFFITNNISTFGFKSVRLIIPSERFVWIPEHLYEPERDRQYLKAVSPLDIGMGVYHLHVPALHSYIIYSASSNIVTAFKLAIPGIDVHCQHSVLATEMLINRSANHPLMLMNVRDGVADFEVCYGAQLLLSNSFKYGTSNERLYQAIGIMKQFHIETPDMELSICGNVDRELFLQLQHYFPNVTLYTGQSTTYLIPEFQTFPTYKHAMLLS